MALAKDTASGVGVVVRLSDGRFLLHERDFNTKKVQV